MSTKIVIYPIRSLLLNTKTTRILLPIFQHIFWPRYFDLLRQFIKEVAHLRNNLETHGVMFTSSYVFGMYVVRIPAKRLFGAFCGFIYCCPANT